MRVATELFAPATSSPPPPLLPPFPHLAAAPFRLPLPPPAPSPPSCLALPPASPSLLPPFAFSFHPTTLSPDISPASSRFAFAIEANAVVSEEMTYALTSIVIQMVIVVTSAVRCHVYGARCKIASQTTW